jgi:hypothetical protein
MLDLIALMLYLKILRISLQKIKSIENFLVSGVGLNRFSEHFSVPG